MTLRTLTIADRRSGRARIDAARPSIEELRDDPTAECRWWNSLSDAERLAYVNGARGSFQHATSDWLDIGETNRLRILDAAYAVECWTHNLPRSSANRG